MRDRASARPPTTSLREMTDPAGGFYATQDADSEGEEGKFFVWNEEEVRAVVVPADASLVLRALGVAPGGNFEHGGKSVLHRPMTLSAVAQLEGRTAEDATAALSRARQQLFEAREKRIHPHRDDKIIAGWNGPMIHGLAAAGAAVGEQRYVDAAVRASEFVATQLTANGRLLRTWRGGQAKIPAFAEDHALPGGGRVGALRGNGKSEALPPRTDLRRRCAGSLPGPGRRLFRHPLRWGEPDPAAPRDLRQRGPFRDVLSLPRTPAAARGDRRDQVRRRSGSGAPGSFSR